MAIIGVSVYFSLKKLTAFADAVLQAKTIALQFFLFTIRSASSSHLEMISSSHLSPYGLLTESLKKK